MIENILGDPSAPGTKASYPVRGSYVGAPERGWAGPYVASLPRRPRTAQHPCPAAAVNWIDRHRANVDVLNTGRFRKHLRQIAFRDEVQLAQECAQAFACAFLFLERKLQLVWRDQTGTDKKISDPFNLY
ncbi:MAG TPA: hypothetical protein VGK48_08720 [Terriglobia bacterium]